MSLLAEYDARRCEDRAKSLLSHTWGAFVAWEQADPRVVELARKDLEDLHARLDRLLRQNSDRSAA